MRNATENAQFVIHMFDQKRLSAFATNATLVPMVDGVLSVVPQVSPTRTTAQNARDWKRIGTAAPRLSTWEQVERICSMRGVV